MKIVYIVLGFIILYINFRSFSMGILGSIIGYFLYNSDKFKFNINSGVNYNRNIRFESLEFPGTRDSFIFFSQCSFAVMGNICKSKGRVTENDIKIAIDFMDQLNLKGDIRKISQSAFNKGKSENFRLGNVLKEFYREFSGNPQIIDLFLEIQIRICFSDGYLDKKEQDILMYIAHQLNISNDEMFRKISLFKNMYNFEQNSSYNYESNRSYNKSSNNAREEESEENDNYYEDASGIVLKDAYAILGVISTDGKDVVKKAYRKLMNEYHPDKLAAKKIPKEYYEIYNKKSQQIINSYKLICEHNGWK